MNFKKPKTLTDYNVACGLMDMVVCATKKGETRSRWERGAIPMAREGKVFAPIFDSFQGKNGGSVYRAIKMEDLRQNRARFADALRVDMKNYKRVYNLFAEVMAS